MAGEVNGKQCYITVDTGSNMSIVRPDFIGREISTQLEGCWMRTVTGERAPIRGREELQLTIGTLQVSHEMWVADITDDCILGTDFQKPYGCQVNFKDSKLTIGSEKVPFVESYSQPKLSCCRVLLKECVDIPPRSEIVVSTRV